VAVNRLWQWHFGEGLQKASSDFGNFGGVPSNRPLLDWLASEFVAKKFDMKAMHKLMVMSETYKRASSLEPAVTTSNTKIDPANDYLWMFRLNRLEAEPIWDSILSSAGSLDLTLGGPSFDIVPAAPRRAAADADANADANAADVAFPAQANRRAAYMLRGFSTSRDVMANFLQSFDVDDGRLPCPLRTHTITAPQDLFLMNSAQIDKASVQLADRLRVLRRQLTNVRSVPQPTNERQSSPGRHGRTGSHGISASGAPTRAMNTSLRARRWHVRPGPPRFAAARTGPGCLRRTRRRFGDGCSREKEEARDGVR